MKTNNLNELLDSVKNETFDTDFEELASEGCYISSRVVRRESLRDREKEHDFGNKSKSSKARKEA